MVVTQEAAGQEAALLIASAWQVGRGYPRSHWFAVAWCICALELNARVATDIAGAPAATGCYR
jgi:hypothetical protein